MPPSPASFVPRTAGGSAPPPTHALTLTPVDQRKRDGQCAAFAG